jgi:hypothetical protein
VSYRLPNVINGVRLGFPFVIDDGSNVGHNSTGVFCPDLIT